MSELQLRRIPWQFDETTPFQWNPANPEFGLIGNVVSFVAPAFERYIVAVVRQAQERITDPAVAEEADLFLRQEALHARAHRNHTAALVAQYPGLQEPLDAADAMYDDLLERESLEYHLAYVADIEATFTPFFRMMLDNEASLFAGGDDRVASLLVWHFVEEIEHRSSALIVYRAVVDGDWYRARKMPSVFNHVRGVAGVIFDAFERHVPEEVRLVDPPRRSTLKRLPAELPAGRKKERAHPSAYADVPKDQLLRMGWGLIRSQLPGHQPRNQPLPAFADAWFDAYDREVDVTRWYESTTATAGASA